MIKQTAFLMLSVAFLGGCQFERLHQPASQQCHHPVHVKITGVDGAYAYKFRREIERALAATPLPSHEPLNLNIELKTYRAEVSYGKDATVSRSQERAKATYHLTKRGSTTPLTQGNVMLASSFNINYDEEFSTLMARNAASDRVIETMAEDLIREILATL